MYAGKSGVFSSIGPIIQPYYTDRKDYDPSSTKLVIESLIDKINQNIKEDQYSLGNTILLVDFSDQLLLVSDVKKSLRKNLHDRALGFEYSGELWHVALGELDMPLTKPSQFLDENANDGILEKAGILKDHNYIKGIIFHIEGKFFSIAEIKEDHLNVINLLEYISEDKHFEVPQTINTERPH